MVQVGLCALLFMLWIWLGFLAFTGVGLEVYKGEHSWTLIYIRYVLATSSTFLLEVFKPQTHK